MINAVLAPLKAFKWYLFAVLVLAIGAYVFTLNQQLANAKATNQALTNQLADSMAAEVTLTTALNDANSSLELVNEELAKRDKLAAKAIEHSKKLDHVINSQREQLAKLKEENEQYKNWSNQPVPSVVNQLFDSTRHSLQNGS